MIDIPYIAEVASLIGDPARTNMLSALKDDGVLSATELAHVAGVAPNTASGHLAKLSAAGLVKVEQKGRNRFYGLACHEVAEALESLEALAVRATPRYRPAGQNDLRIREARSCYDHLAGRFGVGLVEALIRLGYLEERNGQFELLKTGEAAFNAFGIDIGKLRACRRRLIRRCPDWSEQQAHLGGALGAALFLQFTERGWLTLEQGSRTVTITSKGKSGLRKQFSLDI